MKIFVIFCSIFIFSVLSKNEPRVVNIALETSLLFEPKDFNTGQGILRQIRGFVDKLYHSLEPERIKYRSYTLPDVVTNLGNIFLNLTDEKLNNITNVIRAHLDKYKFGRRSGYHEIFDSNLEKSIDKIDGAALQKSIRHLISYGSPELQNLARRLNRFYSQDDLVKLTKSIHKIESYLREDKDPSNILRHSLDFAIFEKYNNLNDSSKVEVLVDLKNISENLNNNSNNTTDQSNGLTNNKEDSNDNILKTSETKYFGGHSKDVDEQERMSHEHTIESSIDFDDSKIELSDLSGSDGDEPHMHHRHHHVE